MISTNKSNDRDRLSRLKAEERDRARRADALRNLSETLSESLDNRVLAVLCIFRAGFWNLPPMIQQIYIMPNCIAMRLFY